MLIEVMYLFRSPQSLTLCLLFFEFFSSALPTTSSDHGAAPIIHRRMDFGDENALIGATRNQAHNLHAAKADVASLTRRGLAVEPLGSGWEVIYEYFDTFLPKAVAAPIFSKFYGDLMMEVIRVAEDNPLSRLLFQQGLFRLEFSSPPNEPIPWQVIYRFANNLLTMTNLGFTSTYNAVYWHQPSGTQIAVKLSLVLDAVMGMSSSGSSGSGS